MTLHQFMVLYSGTAFMVAGVAVLLAWKVLGPAYIDRFTMGPMMRGVVFAHGVACFLRGATLIFPGRAVAVEQMSFLMPIIATTTVAVSIGSAEFLMRYRMPPPLLKRFAHAFDALRGQHPAFALADVAMDAPVAAYGEPPAPDAPPVKLSSPRLRRAVLVAAALGLVLVLGVVLHAAAATLPAA